MLSIFYKDLLTNKAMSLSETIEKRGSQKWGWWWWSCVCVCVFADFLMSFKKNAAAFVIKDHIKDIAAFRNGAVK